MDRAAVESSFLLDEGEQRRGEGRKLNRVFAF